MASSKDHPSDELAARHFDADGRLIVMPAKRTRRLMVLRRIAQQIPLEVELDEFSVNNVLRPVDDDVATLRRFLVNEQLLDRTAPGRYIRHETADA